eukprot:6052750-Pyramimonas_sp.AAC.1
MLVIQCMLHRLRVSGYSASWSNKDLSNAFPPTSWDALELANSLLLEPEDQPFGRDRARSATIQLPASDKRLLVKPRCGALMGDPIRIDSWSEQLLDCVDSESLLAAECPVTHQHMDLSLTKYADDLTKLHVGGGPDSPLPDAGLAELSSINEFPNA